VRGTGFAGVPPCAHFGGNLEGRVRPADGGAGLGDLVGAQGSPCALAVPARPGEPWPMVVRQTISVGLSLLARACFSARPTAATSCPSMGPMTFQP
jgi:hypothetical protein